MARGSYKTPNAIKTLRTLVAYAESEKPPGPALAAVALGAERIMAETLRQFQAMKPPETVRLRQQLRAFLRSLAGDEEAIFGAAFTPNLRPLRAGSRIVLMVGGSPLDVTLFFASAALEQAGTDRLRLCPAPDCGRLFVKIGARRFCSSRCQRRVFLSSYDPFGAVARRPDNPTKGSRHGKTTRAR